MRLYMKQKMFSLKQNFDILDENQQAIYHVEGQLMSIGRKLRIYEVATGKEVAYLEQKVVTLLPEVAVYEEDMQLLARIKKKLTLFKPKYEIEGLNWSVEGDVLAHDYIIYGDDREPLARISKKYFAMTDSFELDIRDKVQDVVGVLAVALAIDMVMDQDN